MDLQKLLYEENEKPLDRIVTDGGYTRIFRTIGCIGDSLSSGEHESRDENGNAGYHDFYEYSWGQYMARNAGLKVFNFSCGGMTAKKYIESYGDKCGCWATDRLCQAYILAQYGPDYDGEFKKKFFVGGHMNAAGYILSAQMITSYIDYTVRHNFEDFSQVGFIGTPYKYWHCKVKMKR